MSIEQYRYEIDTIDKKLISLVERRMKLASKIGKLKMAEELPIEQSDREKYIRKSMYKHSSLEERDIDELYDIIFNLSKKYQTPD